MNATPVFVRALEDFSALADLDQADTPAGRDAWARVVRNAPPEFMDMMSAKAGELGLLPRPAGLDSHGRPVYNVRDVADLVGVTEAEVMAEVENLGIGTGTLAMRAH